MEAKNVLLVCGGGASSGFMAQNIRKAAKKRGLEIDVKARSESEVEDYIEDIDVLLFGPHLKYMEAELQETGKEHNVPVSIIEQSIYGMLDGEKCLELILKLIENNN